MFAHNTFLSGHRGGVVEVIGGSPIFNFPIRGSLVAGGNGVMFRIHYL